MNLCFQNLAHFIKASTPTNQYKEILHNNSLLLPLSTYFLEFFSDEDIININILKQKNKLKELIRRNYIKKIYFLFKTNNIDFIIFKGSILGQMLYDNPFERAVGDIDIYVSPEKRQAAIKILLANDFSFCHVNGESNPHHIQFMNNNIKLELHKNIFTPYAGINENYILTHRNIVTFNDLPYQTFNHTASLLHLIYHEYMDYSILPIPIHFNCLSSRPYPPKYLNRYLDIALYCEKYHDLINWSDIINDLKLQHFNDYIKKIIFDIYNIFGTNIFPEQLIKVITSYKCICTPINERFPNYYLHPIW